MVDLNIQDERRLNPIPVKGFADDVCLASHSKEVLENMLQVGEPLMNEAELDIKISKCMTLYGRRSGNNWYTGKADVPPKFILQNKIIPLGHRNETYTYLGKTLSIEGEDSVQIEEFCSEYRSLIDKICLCTLPVSLKCSAFNNMALAKVLHHFSNTRLKEGVLKDLDKYLINKVRELFRLYSTTTRLIVYLPRMNGGLGIRKVSHVYYITRVAFLIKMLNHPEDIFSDLARRSLQLDMKKRGVSLTNSSNNFLGYEVDEKGYLSTKTKYGCESDWHDLQLYSRKLGVLIQFSEGKAALIVDNIAYTQSKKISEVLKTLLIKKHLEKAKLLSLQGCFFNLNDVDSKNSHCIYYNWNVSDILITFAIKARLNILPTNLTLHIWNRENDPRCPLCHHPSESMAHLLNSCQKFKNFRSRRHDRIVSKLCDFIKQGNSAFEVHENKLARTVLPNLRDDLADIVNTKPDIICVQGNTCILVEVTVCYDIYMSLAYESKISIYTPLVNIMVSRGYDTKLFVVCFGSLGTVHKSIFNSLRYFVTDKERVKQIIKWCSISAIIGSNYIWRHRLKFLNELN